MRIINLAESADAATKIFRTFETGRPDLIPTGFEPIDETVGGLFPGTACILAAGTGVGKSSLVLHAALREANQVGLISLEDPEDVVGSRALAYYSGVDSLRLRTKNLSAEDIAALRRAREYLNDIPLQVAYCIGGRIDEVAEAVRTLAERGVRHVYVDYIQKIRGISEDRRNEVGTALVTLQREADRCGLALTMVSQISRQTDPTKPPSIYSLKESGDLENEARMILMAHKDAGDPRRVHVRLAKSTFGGEGLTFQMFRDKAGVLRLDETFDPETGEF